MLDAAKLIRTKNPLPWMLRTDDIQRARPTGGEMDGSVRKNSCRLRASRLNSAPAGESGFAIVVVLLVIVILTLLGTSFLLMAETENRIAENERLSAQGALRGRDGNPHRQALVRSATVRLEFVQPDSRWNRPDSAPHRRRWRPVDRPDSGHRQFDRSVSG